MSGLVNAGVVCVLLRHGDVVRYCRADLNSKVFVHLFLLAATVGENEDDVDRHK